MRGIRYVVNSNSGAQNSDTDCDLDIKRAGPKCGLCMLLNDIIISLKFNEFPSGSSTDIEQT